MRRDLLKTLSYALVHFTVAFGVVYLLTGSVPIATGVALIEPMANTLAYFLHERAWTFFGQPKGELQAQEAGHTLKRSPAEGVGMRGHFHASPS